MKRMALIAAAVALAVPASAGAVAAAAQGQMVDNFGFANCGDTSGENP